MSYAANANRPNPAAMLGALGVPGAFAAVLIAGLAVQVVIAPEAKNPEATFFPLPEPVEPDPVEPKPQSSTEQQTTQTQQVVITRPDTDFDFELAPSTPVTELPSLDDGLTGISPPFLDVPEVRPVPRFDPVAAAPRGNPGRWITDNDYRASWINRGYSGRAGFTLQIDARGRVTDCRITSSTGYSALDEATCRLLERRAEFTPAKDTSGNIVAGSYSSAVNWEIPE